MRFKLFALGLLLSASGSLVTTTAAAGWDQGILDLEAKKAGTPSGSTIYMWSAHKKDVFAVRFDYENLKLLRGRPFSGVGFLDCKNKEQSELYWKVYDLSKKDRVQVVTEYTNMLCAEMERIYPNSPALK